MWQVRGESVSMERLDGETIAINFDSGEYFSFRGAAADVLWLISSGTDPQHWQACLTAAFPGLEWSEEIGIDVERFLGELVDAGVIEATEASGGPATPLPADYHRGPWVSPSVHANDDLADLLVIDPIHDSGEDGWPQTREQ